MRCWSDAMDLLLRFSVFHYYDYYDFLLSISKYYALDSFLIILMFI